jgi:hypothetical protein
MHPTKSGWLLLAVFLAALNQAAITLPASAGIHAAEWVTFTLAVLSLLCAVMGYFSNGSKAP